MTNNLKLSVCVSTYNQEEYIGECLESLVSQELDFSWNIIVSDDCSTDNTLAIVRSFEARFPDRVVVLENQKNQGPFLNYVNLHSQAMGELVAHMDGDDIARPGKLKTQVAYMDTNPECNICWHRMSFFKGDVRCEHPAVNHEFTSKKIHADELCHLGPFAPHSSTMYRRRNFNRALFKDKCDDWLVSLFYIQGGYGVMLDAVLGEYRITSGSMSSGSVANKKNRQLSTSSQMMAIVEYPDLSRDVATRALANFLLDAVKLRSYCFLSLRVLAYAGRPPKIFKFLKLARFYRWSRLPSVFKS